MCPLVCDNVYFSITTSFLRKSVQNLLRAHKHSSFCVPPQTFFVFVFLSLQTIYIYIRPICQRELAIPSEKCSEMSMESSFITWSPQTFVITYSQCVLLFCVLQTLEKMSSQYQASYQEALAEYNSSKNRFPDKLPSE